MDTTLRFTFALPDPDPQRQAQMFQTALEMARWGDEHSVGSVSIDEHHATGFGWSANPLLTGGMVLAQTKQLQLRAMACLAPLWNPVRFAEDAAVVDQVSGGRLTMVLGLGYRPVEYAAMGLDWSKRGTYMDEFLEQLLAVWRREGFERDGHSVQITPRPLTTPHPFVMVGGSAKVSARRAVRFDLPFQIPDYLPALKEYYLHECQQAGRTPQVWMIGKKPPAMLLIHEDPEKAWHQFGKHMMWEAIEYGAWKTDDMHSAMHIKNATTMADVQASGRYRIVSPDELVEEMVTDGRRAAATLHPLIGGMPFDAAWQSLHLLTDDVIPRVRAALAQQGS